MDRFLKACGVAEPIRLEIRGGSKRRRQRLPRAFALVGRSAAADLRLNHPQVSLRHAYIQVVGGRLACFDLGGRAGLLWDDGRPARSGWLDPGRTVGVGPFTLRLLGEPPASPIANHVDGSPLNVNWDRAGSDAFLEFPDEAGGPVRWNVRRAVTLVGRAPSCRVRLPDETVSWFHCSLVRTDDGLWVVDLLSRGGITINDVPQRCARLEDGDELLVGRFRIIPRYAPSALPPAWAAAPSLPARRESFAITTSAVAVPSQGLPPSAAPAAVDLPLEPELLEFINAHRGDPNSHAITLLVEKFGQMQQQMLEQFHQTMMMMIQHMGETHRDQLRQVREEVDRLRLLSEELVSVKAQLEHTPAAPTTGPQPEPTTADAAGPPPQEAPRTFEIPEPRPGAEDPLVMVTRRIAQIRSEQRSRWQRILDLVRTPR